MADITTALAIVVAVIAVNAAVKINGFAIEELRQCFQIKITTLVKFTSQ